MSFIIQWIDLAWLPLILLVVEKRQRLMSAGFFICCAIMMRLMAELMESTGYKHGFLPLLGSHVYTRGLIVYSLFYILFMVMVYYSKDSRGPIFLAASISMFFLASCVYALVMVL